MQAELNARAQSTPAVQAKKKLNRSFKKIGMLAAMGAFDAVGASLIVKKRSADGKNMFVVHRVQVPLKD